MKERQRRALSYFRANHGGEGLDLTKAALPFHDPDFWTDPIGTPVTVRDPGTVLNDVDNPEKAGETSGTGTGPPSKGWGELFQLIDSSGNLFYTDNENPYVDIKLYPQDNWNDIIAAYVSLA